MVVWALDFTPNKHVQDLLSSQLGEEAVLVGVGGLEKAEEILSVMHEVRADEAVVGIEDPCEMNKLLKGGVQPLIAIIEEVCRAPSMEKCAGYNVATGTTAEEGGGVRVLRVKGFVRVAGIVFQLVEPSKRRQRGEES